MNDISTEELRQIADLVHVRHGYDFRNYAMSSFKRRMLRILDLKNLSLQQLLSKINDQNGFIDDFVDSLTVNVTEMFRDPGFWRVLKEDVLGEREGPLRIWHAGCSSGEEVISMCILLREAGVTSDITMLATDLDNRVLQRARSGSVSLKNMELHASNYSKMPGQYSLRHYYHEEDGQAVFHKDLLDSISFAQHDLVTGEMPGPFDLILCRNVMIYFNQELQNEVVRKFHRSLARNGHLAVGAKESLLWCDVVNKFRRVRQEEKIYRKIRD